MFLEYKATFLYENSRPPRKMTELYSPSVSRGLASYLTLDKLLLLGARDREILSEIRDPHGQIWSDRVWAEIGDPWIDVMGLGPRYYHLWSMQSLRPWGYLVVDLKGYLKIGTMIYCRWAHVYSYVARKMNEISLTIFAITPRGLELFEANNRTWGTNNLHEAIAGKGGRLLTTESIVTGFHNGINYFFLTRGGKILKYGKGTLHPLPGEWPLIRYLREIPLGAGSLSKGAYCIDQKGDRFLQRDFNKPLNRPEGLLSATLASTSWIFPPPSQSRLTYDLVVWSPDSYNYYSISSNIRVQPKRDSPPPGYDEGKLYLTPNEELIRKIHEADPQRKFIPLQGIYVMSQDNFPNILYLGTDGTVDVEYYGRKTIDYSHHGMGSDRYAFYGVSKYKETEEGDWDDYGIVW